MENLNTINKIIKELSMRDYLSQWNKLTKTQKYNVYCGKRQFSYILAQDTLEAVKIANQYRDKIISEEEYKAFCLKYNLTH